MDEHEIYKLWLESRTAVRPPGPGFSSQVMEKLKTEKKEPGRKTIPVFRYGIAFIESKIMRIAFSAALSGLGLLRIGYIGTKLLIP